MKSNRNVHSPQFEATSLEDWVKQIKKDLKGADLESIYWKIDNLVTISPIQHFENHTGDQCFDKKPPSWLIGESFKLDQNPDSSFTKNLLGALKNGMNAPEFIFKAACFFPDFNKLFDKVILDYITPFFSFDDIDCLKTTILEYDQYLTAKNYSKENNILYIQYNGNQLDLLELYSQFKSDYPKWRFFTIHEKNFRGDESKSRSIGACVQETVDLLVRIGQEGKGSIQSLVDRITWRLKSSPLFYVELCRIRAMRWVWGLALETLQQDNYQEPTFDLHITMNGEDPNKDLISATTQAVSAALGGVYRISIHSMTSSNDYQRLGRNIQNIMQLESQLDKVVDPSEGSYFLEKLTEKIAQAAWQLIRF